VERRCHLNHTFKIKVIWEQNHILETASHFYASDLQCFLNARKRGVPLTFIVTLCSPLLPSVQRCYPPHLGRQHLRAIGTKSTSLAGDTKLGRNGGGERGEETLCIDASENEELLAKWGFLTLHAPLQDSLFQFL